MIKIKKLLYQQEIRKINSHKLRKQEKNKWGQLPPSPSSPGLRPCLEGQYIKGPEFQYLFLLLMYKIVV
jgi:hypothetical protein